MQHVKFTRMKDGDEEDYRFLLQHDTEYAGKTGERLIIFLEQLEHSFSAFQVTRLEHTLQTATRAWFDGADIDWIVTALLHDIGDVHAPYNHGDYAATVLAPFVREQCSWSARFHGDFQAYYYPENVGINKYARNKHMGQMYFEDCKAFCERWDQPSFDPEYSALPLNNFVPIMLEVFSRKPFDPLVIRPGIRQPLTCKKIATQRFEQLASHA